MLLERWKLCIIDVVEGPDATFTDKRPCHSDTDHLVNKGLGYNGVAIPGMEGDISGVSTLLQVRAGRVRVSLIDLLGINFRELQFSSECVSDSVVIF